MGKIVLTKAIRNYQEFLDRKGANKEAYAAKTIPPKPDKSPYSFVELVRAVGVSRGMRLYFTCPICMINWNNNWNNLTPGNGVIAIKTRRKETLHTDKQWVLVCTKHFLQGEEI